MQTDEPIDELTELVIGLAIKVHDALGPGLLESIYRDCLVLELVANGLEVEVERRVPVIYREQRTRDDLKIDILVNGRLIIEIKAVRETCDEHVAQLLGYLRSSRIEHGLLVNFGAPKFHIKKYVLTNA